MGKPLARSWICPNTTPQSDTRTARWLTISGILVTIVCLFGTVQPLMGDEPARSGREASSLVGESVPKQYCTLEEIRAPKRAAFDQEMCDTPLTLTRELSLVSGLSRRLIVTIHKGKWRCDRVTIWRETTGKGFQEARMWEGGTARDLRVLHYAGHRFIHVAMTSPSAGHEWIVDKLLFVAPDSTLHEVGVDRSTECGAILPPVNSEEPEYGGSYTFRQGRIEFRKFVTPKPSGSTPSDVEIFHGTLDIAGTPNYDPESGRYKPTFMIVVKSCVKEDEGDDP